MKKLFYLSAIVFAVTIQGTALASRRPERVTVNGVSLVREFCNQYSNSSLSQEEVAEKIKLYISELDNPTLEQLSALLDISEEMEEGWSLSAACR